MPPQAPQAAIEADGPPWNATGVTPDADANDDGQPQPSSDHMNYDAANHYAVKSFEDANRNSDLCNVMLGC